MTNNLKNNIKDAFGLNFIEKIINRDLASNKFKKIKTRFPPEPNGYLHLGHTKSICLNFELARKYNGSCVLRMDDTNPTKERDEYIQNIKNDVSWLGYKWDELRHASDYFELFYDYAVKLIKLGLAYVEISNRDEFKNRKGNYFQGSIISQCRDNSVTKNLLLFESMKNGDFKEGEAVLRAKINLNSGNMVMRDPVIYRIIYAYHPNSKNDWIIYPMYDFAHPLSDVIEGITHSICTLEFQDNRFFYDWLLKALEFKNPPHQYEFSKLNIEGMVLSKRLLSELVNSNLVSSWDDPRMPTLSGLRKKGVPAEAIRKFCSKLGISKQYDAVISPSVFDNSIRELLNLKSRRGFAVLKPLKLFLINLEKPMQIDCPINPIDKTLGYRKVILDKYIYISQDDFIENIENLEDKGYKGLYLNGSVRLRYACMIKVIDFKKDEYGNIIEIIAIADLDSFGCDSKIFSKSNGVIHWLSCISAKKAVYYKYSLPFKRVYNLNRSKYEMKFDDNSCTRFDGVILEEILIEILFENLDGNIIHLPWQFEREGYFFYDRIDSSKDLPIFHQTAALK